MFSSSEIFFSVMSRLQITNQRHFSWGQILLRTQCSGVFQNGPFSSSLSERNQRGFFSDLYHEKLVELPGLKFKKVWGALWLGPPGVFISQTCSRWTSRNFSVTAMNFLSEYCFPQKFLVSRFLLPQVTCLFNFGGCGLFCDFSDRSKNCWFFQLVQFSAC